MYAFESAKSRFEKLTGWAQPTRGEIKTRIKKQSRAQRFSKTTISFQTIPPCLFSIIGKSLHSADCPIHQRSLSDYSRQTDGSMHGAMAFTIMCITTRERMKCLASHEGTRGCVSAVKKVDQFISAQVM